MPTRRIQIGRDVIFVTLAIPSLPARGSATEARNLGQFSLGLPLVRFAREEPIERSRRQSKIVAAPHAAMRSRATRIATHASVTTAVDR